MSIIQRSLSNEEDTSLMLALAKQFPASNLHVIDLPYRLSSWALNDPENVRLWFDESGQIAAWAVIQTPFWTIDYVCHPQFESALHSEILAWADERARAALGTESGHPAWFVMAFSGQESRIRDLERMGFSCQAEVGEDSWSQVLMQRPSLEPAPEFTPPAGYVVRPLAGESEVQGYVDLHQSVFESKNMSVDWRTRMLQHPNYQPNLDIVVQAPDGRLVAFCVCWFDEPTLSGQVEPLGCHKDFRRFALGRVALSEGLRRLQSLGAKRVFVETDSFRNTAFRLYESVGFEVIEDILVYRKDYEEA